MRRRSLSILGAMVLVLAGGVFVGTRAGDGGKRGDSADQGRIVPDSKPRPRPSTTTTVPPPRSFTLVATGDVLLHTALWEQARADANAAGRPGAMDFAPMLSGVKPVVSSADVAICHMETPMAPPNGPYASYPVFSVPQEIAPAIASTGFDACTTGSNHTFDKGAAGIERTLGALDGVGIKHAGSARNPQEAMTTTILDVDGVRVAMLSYTFSFNGYEYPNGETWRANIIDEARILADAATAKQRGAEVVVVSMHWGNEYVHQPSAQQMALAPKLIRSPNIDLLLGHHAHVVQPVQQIDGEWVVYGMGNMIANQMEPPRAEGLLTRFTFTEIGTTWRVTDAAFEPLFTLHGTPIRLYDVNRMLADPSTDTRLRQRLIEARDRTTGIVGQMGALQAGLHPITP